MEGLVDSGENGQHAKLEAKIPQPVEGRSWGSAIPSATATTPSSLNSVWLAPQSRYLLIQYYQILPVHISYYSLSH